MAKVNLYALIPADLHRKAGLAAHVANQTEIVAHGR